MRFSREHKILFAILIVAFLLRIPSIVWGVPFFNDHATVYDGDEPKLIMAVLKFPPHLSVMPHPTFYHYFLGLTSLPVKMILPYTDSQSFLFLYFSLFLYIRVITLFTALVCIYLVYLLGKRVYDERSGLLAAGVVSVSMIHVMYSVMAIVYVPLSLLITAGFYKLFDLDKDKSLKIFIYTGCLTGLMIGTKYTGALFFVPFLLYSALIMRGHPGKKVILRNMALAVLAAIIVLCVTTPTLFDKTSWHKMFIEIKELSAGNVNLLSPGLWKSDLVDLMRAVGIPLACLFLFGIIYPFRKDLKEISFLSFIAGMYIYFSHGVSPKYTIVMIPVFALLSSKALVSLYEKTRSKRIVVSLIAFIFAYSILHDMTAVYLRLNDTRTQASEFIDKSIPPGTTVGIGATSEEYPWRYHKWRYPYIDFTKYNEKYFLEDPEILILSSFDYQAFERGTPISDPEGWYRFSPPSQEIYDFYTDILSGKSGKYKLVKEFRKPDIIYIDMPSPEIRVYEKVAGR